MVNEGDNFSFQVSIQITLFEQGAFSHSVRPSLELSRVRDDLAPIKHNA